MVTRLIAQALLRSAARRWPAHYLPEWMAELHVMESEDRRFAMLRYAASLAVSRPAVKQRGALSMTGKAWGTAAMVFMAPVTTAVAWFVALMVGEVMIGEALQGVSINWFLVSDVFPELRSGIPQAWTQPTALVVVCVIAVVTRVISPWTLPTGPVLTAIMLVIAVLPVPFLTQWAAQAEWERQARDAAYSHWVDPPPTSQYSAIILWAGCTALLLIGVARLSRRGRHGLAWTAGVAGTVLMLDLFAVVAAESVAVGVAGFSWVPWLNNNYSAYLLLCSGYLLGYAIGVARPAVQAQRRAPTLSRPSPQHL